MRGGGGAMTEQTITLAKRRFPNWLRNTLAGFGLFFTLPLTLMLAAAGAFAGVVASLGASASLALLTSTGKQWRARTLPFLRGGWLAASSIVLMMVSSAFMPTAPESTQTAKPNQPAAPAVKSQTTAPPTPAAPPAQDRHAIKQAAADLLWKDFEGAIKTCDGRYATLSRQLRELGRGAGSHYDVYASAVEVGPICSEAASHVGDLRREVGQRRGLPEFQTALETCQSGYLLRSIALIRLQTVLNGDERPSTVNPYRQAAQQSEDQLLQCAGALLRAGKAAGVEMPVDG